MAQDQADRLAEFEAAEHVTLDEAARTLAAAGIESPRAEARLLYAHALGSRRDETLVCAQAHARAGGPFGAMVARRAAREPVAYITGHKEFWSMDFAVGPGVLVPRPETETLIEEALRLVPDRERAAEDRRSGRRFGRDSDCRAEGISQRHRHRL